MSDTTDGSGLDNASNGGGIGDIGRQPVDPSPENLGNGEPVILPDEGDMAGEIDDDDPTGGDAIATEEVDEADDEDPDDSADETSGEAA